MGNAPVVDLLLSLCLLFHGTAQPILNDTEIVIVGAGLAGLSAADTLINIYGFKKVWIIEGTSRIGGRIRSMNSRSGGYILELGAEWISGRRFNPLYHLALGLNALGVTASRLSLDFEGETLLFTSNGCRLQSHFKSKLTRMWHWLTYATEKFLQKSTNKSASVMDLFNEVVNDYLTKKDLLFHEKLSYYKALFEIFRIHSALMIGSNFMETASTRAWSYARDKPYDWRIPLGTKGFRPILAYYMRRIGFSKIKLKTTVELIDYQTDRKSNEPDYGKIRVLLSSGEQIEAEHVIVTSSLGYLKQHAAFMYRPPLPFDKMNFIDKMGFGIMDKLFLIYDKPFWPKNVSRIELLRVEDDDWDCSFSKKNLESSIERIFWRFEIHPHFYSVLSVSIVNNTDPAIFELASSRIIAMAATSVLRRFSTFPNVPMPVEVLSWGLERHFLGSYPYMSVECSNDPSCTAENFTNPVKIVRFGQQIPAILFAGDALSTDLHYASQAAVISGRFQAESLYRFYLT